MWGMPVAARRLNSLQDLEDGDDLAIPAAHICHKEFVAYAT